MNMVKEVTTKNDASLVAKIPLSRKSKLDKMIWRDFIIRVFSIKSAYYEARMVLGRKKVEREQYDKVWRRIWTTNVAPKIKYFIWRLIQRFIPMRIRLQKKGFQIDTRCAVCGS